MGMDMKRIQIMWNGMTLCALQYKSLNEIKICNKSWNGQKTCKTWNEVGLTFWLNIRIRNQAFNLSLYKYYIHSWLKYNIINSIRLDPSQISSSNMRNR